MGRRVSIFSGQPSYLPVVGVTDDAAYAQPARGGSVRQRSELGYYLAKAQGYRVVSAAGHTVGVLNGLRYRDHSDYPDELMLRSGLLRRARLLPFAAVESVDPRAHIVRLR